MKNFISKLASHGKVQTAHTAPQEGASLARLWAPTDSESTVETESTNDVTHYCAAFTVNTYELKLFLIP